MSALRFFLIICDNCSVMLERICTSGAGTSVLQVKAERTFTAEGPPGVHAPGTNGAGIPLTLIHIWKFRRVMVLCKKTLSEFMKRTRKNREPHPVGRWVQSKPPDSGR